MTAKERLVEELKALRFDLVKAYNKNSLEELTEKFFSDIADKFLADRARIVEPLVKHKHNKKHDLKYADIVYHLVAIDEAIKLSGV